MPEAQDRRGALRILAPALSKPLLAEASRMVQSIGDARERASSMVSLARRDLPEALVHKVIAECESFPDPADRAGMLVGMLRQVPEPLAQDIRAKAKSDAAQVEDPLIRASLRQSLDPEAIELEAEDSLKQLCKTIEEGRSVATHPWAAEAWAAEPLGNYLADEHYGPVARLLNIFGPHMSVLQLRRAQPSALHRIPAPESESTCILGALCPGCLERTSSSRSAGGGLGERTSR